MKPDIETAHLQQRSGKAVKLVALTALLSLWLVCDRTAAQQAQPETVATARQQRLEQMKSQGPDATLTVLPVRIAGKPVDRVTELVGLLLEQQGLKNIELGTSFFDPAEADMEQLAEAVGKFIQQHPITTDYALYVEYNVDAQQGQLTDVRAIFVDQQGAVVGSEQLQAEDEALQKRQAHRDLMSLSVAVVERLAPQLGLSEQTARVAQPGKMARIMEARSGLPPQAERSAMPAREQQLRKAGPTSTLLVLPPRVLGRATDPASAQALANQLNNARLCQAEPAEQVIEFTASQQDPNELKVLWDLAREVRDYLRQHPPQAEYVLCADYVFNPQQWEQGFVHFVVCDRQGEWVLVDMQNSHHEDYQAMRPRSQADCDRLLVQRLEERLQAVSHE